MEAFNSISNAFELTNKIVEAEAGEMSQQRRLAALPEEASLFPSTQTLGLATICTSISGRWVTFFGF